MKVAPLLVEVSPRSIAAMRAAWAIRSHPRLSVQFRTTYAAHELPRGRVLRIESGSRVEPMVTLLSGVERPGADEDDMRAARLGLNAAVFTAGRQGYEWSGSAKPLPPRAALGTPSTKHPWVLVAPGLRYDVRTVERLTGLRSPQLHYLGPALHSPAVSGVWWLPSPSIALSLLGRVTCVLAPSGPLAWDAARLGVPIVDPDPMRRLPAAIAERRLARLVPAALVSDAGFWHALGSQLAEAEFEGEWGTMAWLLRARDAGRRPRLTFGATAFKRKLLKLRRDPKRFWADARFGKATLQAIPRAR